MTLPTASMPPSMPPPGAHPSAEVEARAIELRAEAEVVTGRTFKAALLYAAAQLTEAALSNPVQSVQDYLAAYNADHRLRLPLYALLRVFERKRSHKNLQRLYDAELRSARTPLEKATAYVDQGVLATITAGDLEVARVRFERAIEQAPELADSSLLLEWNRRTARDRDGASAALAHRAETCDDPVHQGALVLELAGLREAAGDIGGALEMLREAALGAGPQQPLLAALTRLARAHGHTQDLVEATERTAEIARQQVADLAAQGAVEQPLVERSTARAAALWYEAARLRLASLGDADGALACLTKACALRPDDVLLRQTRMLAYDMLEDRERAAHEADRLLSEGYAGEHAAALHFRLAEVALVAGDTEGARERLVEAIAQAGDSIAADAILDDLLLDEDRHRERIERREATAASAEPGRAGRALMEASLLAAHELGDRLATAALLGRANLISPDQPEILREGYGTALDLNDPDLALFSIDRLVSQAIDDEERAALLHHRLELTPSPKDAVAWIASHESALLALPSLRPLCALRAAEAGDHALLSRVHEALATSAGGVDEAVAQLCAAARASLQAGHPADAEDALRRALARAPAQRYARTLLEEVLRARGESHEVVALLRETAEAQENAQDAELSLLLAGAAAEGGGDPKRAAENYEEAADRNPMSVGPLWALLRLAQRTRNPQLELQAREGLAGQEQADGATGTEALLLAEHYDRVSDKPELAEPWLAQGMMDPNAGPHAAAGLCLLRGISAERREEAHEVLVSQASGAGLSGLLREQGGTLLLHSRPASQVLRVVERCATQCPHDRWAMLARTCLAGSGPQDVHAAALDLLSTTVTDPQLAAAARTEALWTRRLVPRADPLAPDPSLAHWATDGVPDRAAAEAVLDLVGPAEAASRARALTLVRQPFQGPERTDLSHALARARLALGDAVGTVALCEEALSENPDDLVALDMIRVAARQCGRYRDVASACERLAGHLASETWAELLEEAAGVRMDMLDDPVGAEANLRRVLEHMPMRPNAYGRLHDLLTEREDAAAVMDLVQHRVSLIDAPEELARLFYELARLHRADGNLEGALDALDNLSMLEENVGGLALQAEIHAGLENWPSAVQALQALASAAGVPKAQRRLARLGAADFLENRLRDPEAALVELEKLEQSGHGDVALYQRIADAAERCGRLERTVGALASAAGLARGDARIDALMRAGQLLRTDLRDADRAEEMFARTLTLRPGHADAARSFVLVCRDDTKKAAAIGRFENEVRSECAAHPTEAGPLRKLALVGELSGQPDITYAALTALLALELSNVAEREAVEAAARCIAGTRVSAGRSLPDALLADFLLPCFETGYAALLRTVLGASAELDQLDRGHYGVGRGQKVSPRETNQVRDDVAALAEALSLPLGDFYVGGDEPTRLAVLAHDGQVSVVVGVGVTAPLGSARRHQVALHLAGIALSTQPLLTRSSVQGARLVQAALVAADVALPHGPSRDALGDQPRLIGKVLPRRVRKALPDLARALPDGGAKLERQCVLALRHTRRLALALSGDLHASLEQVLGTNVTRQSISDSEDALDVIRAWTSSPMLLLRMRLGLAR